MNTKPKNSTPKAVTIKALVDTGGSATLVKSSLVKKLKSKKEKKTVWSTPGGTMNTSKKCKVQFT
eukprot:76824-Chlamydomonas_euryale.AAC.1